MLAHHAQFNGRETESATPDSRKRTHATAKNGSGASHPLTDTLGAG